MRGPRYFYGAVTSAENTPAKVLICTSTSGSSHKRTLKLWVPVSGRRGKKKIAIAIFHSPEFLQGVRRALGKYAHVKGLGWQKTPQLRFTHRWLVFILSRRARILSKKYDVSKPWQKCMIHVSRWRNDPRGKLGVRISRCTTRTAKFGSSRRTRLGR